MAANDTLNSRLCYYASTMFVDEQIGHIYQTLEETGLLNNTCIIFTGRMARGIPISFTPDQALFAADHGDGQGPMSRDI